MKGAIVDIWSARHLENIAPVIEIPHPPQPAFETLTILGPAAFSLGQHVTFGRMFNFMDEDIGPGFECYEIVAATEEFETKVILWNGELVPVKDRLFKCRLDYSRRGNNNPTCKHFAIQLIPASLIGARILADQRRNKRRE